MAKTRILMALILSFGLAAPSHAYFAELVKKFENDLITHLEIFRDLITGITVEFEGKLKDQKQQTPEAIAKWLDQMRDDFKKRSDNAVAGVKQSSFLSDKFKLFLLKVVDEQIKRLDVLRKRLEAQKASQETTAASSL